MAGRKSKIASSMRKSINAQRAQLLQLSSDIDASLRSPKDVKVKSVPWYVDDGSGARGRAQKILEDELRTTTPKMLGFAFGRGYSLRTLSNDTYYELENQLGKAKALNELYSSANRVIIHLIAQAAQRISGGRTEYQGLKEAKDYFVAQFKAENGKLTEVLDKLNSEATFTVGTSTVTNPLHNEVYNYLYPLSLEYLEVLSANTRDVANEIEAKKLFVMNELARRAVVLYISKKAPSNQVLMPVAMESKMAAALRNLSSAPNTAIDELDKLLNKYGKDLEATYQYYKAAVQASYASDTGIDIGMTDASVKAAIVALNDAKKGLSALGVSSSVQSQFRSGFDAVIRRLNSVNAKKGDEAATKIVFATRDLLDLIGALEVSGTGAVSVLTGVLSGLGTAGRGLKGAVTDSAKVVGLKYGVSNVLQDEIEFASLRTSEASGGIIPTNINNVSTTNIIAQPVVNNISRALLSLRQAYESIMSGIVSQPELAIQVEPTITDDFKKAAIKQINSVKNLLLSSAIGKANVSSDVYKVGLGTALNNMLNIVSSARFDDASGSTPTRPVNGTDLNVADLPESTYQKIAQGDIPGLNNAVLGRGTLEEIVMDSIESLLSGGVALKTVRATQRQLLTDINYFEKAIDGFVTQYRGMGMLVRKNPAGSTIKEYAVSTGKGAVGFVAGHGISAVGNRVIQPVHGSVADIGIDVAGGAITVGGAHVLANRGTITQDTSKAVMVGAGVDVALRLLMKHTNLRFSENFLVKYLLNPLVSVPAGLIGDHSLCASSLTPVSLKGLDTAQTNQMIVDLARANSQSALVHIAAQIVQHSGETALTVEQLVGKAKEITAQASVLCNLNCLMSNGVKVEVDESGSVVTGDVSQEVGDSCAEAIAACGGEVKKVLIAMGATEEQVKNLKGLGSFILEPGYNMDVYSGADQTHYLQPAPMVTSQSGMVQLENAIARSEKLTATDKVQEGIGDLQDVAVIRASSNLARQIENAGMGVSLGQSRMNPSHELVALEVEGDTGLMPIAPERQHSVPQGSLTYTKIGQAPSVDVSPTGLFNRGVFSPTFRR